MRIVRSGWSGEFCEQEQEHNCEDGVDNDGGELVKKNKMMNKENNMLTKKEKPKNITLALKMQIARKPCNKCQILEHTSLHCPRSERRIENYRVSEG